MVSQLPPGFQLEYQPRPDTSAGRTVMEQGLQGATFGLSDEIMDRLGAAGAVGYSHLPSWMQFAGKVRPEDVGGYDKALTDARRMSAAQLAAQMEERPILSTASNLGGALFTGGVGASTKGGQAINAALRSASLPARVAAGAVTGAVGGGLYGAGAAQEGERLQGAQEGAIMGGLTGGALPVLGRAAQRTGRGVKNVARGFGYRMDEALGQSLDSLKKVERQAWDAIGLNDTKIAPEAVNSIVTKMGRIIADEGFDSDLNKKTLLNFSKLQRMAQTGEPITMKQLDNVRKSLNRVKPLAEGAEDAFSAGVLKRSLIDSLSALPSESITGNKNAPAALKEAIAKSAQANRFADVADVLRKAGDDPNRIKSALTRFVNKGMPGFTPDEQAALREAANTTAPEKVQRLLGKFGFDLGSNFMQGSTMIPALTLGGSALAGNPVAAAIVPAGTAAKSVFKKGARGKAEQALRVIEGSAKYAQPGKGGAGLPMSVAGGAMGQNQFVPDFEAEVTTQPQMSALPEGFVLEQSAPAQTAIPALDTSNIPVGAVNLLISRPDLARDFDAMYGKGASDVILQQLNQR